MNVEGLKFLPEAESYARMGILPAGVYRNRHFAEEKVDGGELSLAIQDLLYDPQTSGGLMMAVRSDRAEELLQELKEDNRVPAAFRVGEVREYRGGKRIFLSEKK